MNKRIVASFLCVAMLLSLGAGIKTPNGFLFVDAVASATAAGEWSAPSTGTSKPAPVVWDTATEITRLIAINSAGGEVKLLQSLLNEAGYSLNVDGIVGPKTLAAIEGFQAANGLRVDGIVGPKTLAKLAPFMEKVEEVVEEVVEEPVVVEPVEEVEEEVVEEEVDAVSGPSINITNQEDFLFSISSEGNWITTLANDLTVEEKLVLDGQGFKNGDTPDRKIGLYSVATVDGVRTETPYTLTAPAGLTINSSPARMLGGTFVGDIYVASDAFLLKNMVVEGNVYFLNNDAKAGFENDNSTINGETILISLDAVSTASIVDNKEDFLKSVTTKENGGNWITALLKDMVFEEELVLEGEGYENRGTPDRKIGLYANGEPLEDGTKTISHRFTLKAPKLTIKSSPARMLRGTFEGDIYVEADNFKLQEVEVIGNVFFATESAKETFENVDSTISGVQEVIAE